LAHLDKAAGADRLDLTKIPDMKSAFAVAVACLIATSTAVNCGQLPPCCTIPMSELRRCAKQTGVSDNGRIISRSNNLNIKCLPGYCPALGDVTSSSSPIYCVSASMFTDGNGFLRARHHRACLKDFGAVYPKSVPAKSPKSKPKGSKGKRRGGGLPKKCSSVKINQQIAGTKCRIVC